MSRIDELIAELAPKGVEFKAVGEVTTKTSNIRWATTGDAEFQYIDLSSVDRVTHRIGETASITADSAPSRAQQIVRIGDVIFATTRPAQMRWAVIQPEYDGQIASTGYCVLRPDTSVVLTNFLAHLLGADAFQRYVEANQVAGSYPSITDDRVRAYRIPVPPLEVQREIVRVLDQFTQLEAELEAELEARRRQYVFYRRVVLRRVNAERASLSSLGKWQGGITPSKSDSRYWTDGDIPWLASMDISDESTDEIRGRVTEAALRETSLKIVPAPSVAVVMRSNILRRRLPIGLVKVGTTVNQDVRALIPREGVDAEYVYHALKADSEEIRSQCVRADGSMAAVNSQDFFAWKIPLPSFEEQRRIAAELRSFDALVNDLSVGLPAELAARRKQYEYYRDRLLTFREAAT